MLSQLCDDLAELRELIDLMSPWPIMNIFFACRARVLRDEINAARTSIDRRIASSGFGGRRAPSGMGAAPSYPPAEAPRHQAQRAPPQDYQVWICVYSFVNYYVS